MDWMSINATLFNQLVILINTLFFCLIKAHYNIIESEVREMERLASQLQVPSPEERDPLREEVLAILQAWEEVGRNMAENRCRLEKFHQIQDYFENYLGMM